MYCNMRQFAFDVHVLNLGVRAHIFGSIYAETPAPAIENSGGQYCISVHLIAYANVQTTCLVCRSNSDMRQTHHQSCYNGRYISAAVCPPDICACFTVLSHPCRSELREKTLSIITHHGHSVHRNSSRSGKSHILLMCSGLMVLRFDINPKKTCLKGCSFNTSQVAATVEYLVNSFQFNVSDVKWQTLYVDHLPAFYSWSGQCRQ